MEGLQRYIADMKSAARFSDRKTAAQKLENHLTQDVDNICKQLDINSILYEKEKNKGDFDKITWTRLFLDVQSYFDKELANDKQLTGPNRIAFISVVKTVFTKATRNRPWLHWQKVLDFIKDNLNDARIAKLYGPSLMNFLEAFLAVEMYKDLIDTRGWKNLIETLIKCHKKHNIVTASILNCMKTCIQHGSSHPGVIVTLRKRVVNFYVKLIEENHSVLQEDILPYLEGLISLCQMNATEFRTILCKTGESIIPHMVPPQQTLRDDQEAALFDFLLYQYSLHMPFDVDISSDGFYASDVSKWKDIIKTTYIYCTDTIEDIVNKSNNRGRATEVKIPFGLLSLAAKCTKQISSPAFAENDNSEGEDDGIVSKKTMRYKSFGVIISEISTRPISEGLFIWLLYVSEVLNRFPELVDTKTQFSHLINVGASLCVDSRQYTTRAEFYTYFSSLLNVEKHLREKGILTEISETWSLVWETTIRTISVSKDRSGACLLLRRILKDIRPDKTDLLLSGYLNHSIPPEKCTVELLAEFLSLCSIPIQMKCSVRLSQSTIVDEEIATTSNARLALLRWLLKAWNELPSQGCELLAPLMCSLIVKQSHALITKEIDLHLESSKDFLDFESVILKICFVKMEPNVIDEDKSLLSSSELSDFKFIIQENLADRFMESLQMELQNVPELLPKAAEFGPQGNYKKFISKLTLCLNVLNVVDKHLTDQLAPRDQQPKFVTTLHNTFSTGIKRFNTFLSKCFETSNTATKNPEKIQQLIESVGALFQNIENLSKEVQKMLSQAFSNDVLTFIKEAYRCNLSRYVDRASNNTPENSFIFDDELPSRLRVIGNQCAAELDIITRNDRRYESMSMAAIRTLTGFGILSENADLLSELMVDLYAETVGSAYQFLFDGSFEIILKCAKVMSELQTIVPSALAVLQKCCRKFFMLPKCLEKIWIMFKEMIPAIAQMDSDTRRKFMILVGTAYMMLTKQDQPIYVYSKCFEAMSELAKHDPSSTWASFQPENAARVWVLEGLHNFVTAKSQLIRMWAVDSICAVFENALPYDYNGSVQSSQGELNASAAQSSYQEKRKTLLQLLYDQLVQSYDVEMDLFEDELIEECINRTSIALSCLTRLIFAFPYTKKTIVIYLFLIVKLKNIEVNVANRALKYASPEALKTICSHLPYVLKKTLQLKQNVGELPYQLFGCNTLEQFFKAFHKEICAELFQQNEMTQLNMVATKLNKDVQSLVQESYGLIMARVTPGLTILHYQLKAFQNQRLAQYNTIHKRLIETLGGKDVTDALLAEYLGDVVLNLISLTFDPAITNQWGVTDIKMTEPVPPHYPESLIENCLKFLQSISPHSHLTVIGYLANTSHEPIYKILLSLRIRIHEAHDNLEMYWRLHQFSFFVNLLLKEPPEVFSTMKEYVFNFVFSTYLKLLSRESGSTEYQLQFRRVILYLIKDVIDKIIDEYLDEMLVFFDQIIRDIVAVVQKSPELMRPAKEILDFLLIQHAQTFGTLVESLDPFPANIGEFHQYSMIQNDKKYGSRKAEWSLARELEAILQHSEGSAHSGEQITKERLLFLKELLVERKRDLDRMVRNLDSKRFSEECQSDPLHGVIQMLIAVTHSCRDEELITEASRCLGEIGPVNLSVLVLPHYKRQGKIHDDRHGLVEIFKIIAGYLASEDIRLVETSGEVLKSLLQYTECSKALKNNLGHTRLYNSLNPFHCVYESNRRNSSDKIYTDTLEHKLGLNEMDEGIDFRSWLTRLTIGLIECFKEDSSFVTHFIPLCEARIDFCESIFPYVVYLTMSGGRSNINVKRTMTGYFRNFFSKFVTNSINATESSRSFTPSSFGATTCSIYLNKLALRSLIRAIQFLRRHPMPQEMKGKVKVTPWDSNFWMDINYMDVARAAQYCGAYLTSIMYIEIAATEMEGSFGGGQSIESRSSREDSQDEFYSQGVSVRNRTEAAKIERLLLKAYSTIGETDAAYGCGSARFSDTESSMHHMAQTMDWHRLLMLANGSYINSESSNESQVALALKQQGLYNVLWDYLKGVESVGRVLPDELAQIQFECGWRLTKWDLNTDKPAYIKGLAEKSSSTQSTFQKSIYESLQSGLIDDKPNYLRALENGFKTVGNELKHATLESSENLYGFMSRLQMLRVVEDFFEQTAVSDVNTFLKKWKLQDKVPTGDFKYHEPSLFLRNVLLRSYDERKPVNLEGDINESLLDIIAKAREAGRLDLAESCATAMASLGNKPSIAREFEVAKNNWARGSADVARSIISKLIKKCPNDDPFFPSLLLLYGEWLSTSHCERPGVILEKYLQKSCTLYESKRSSASLQEASKAYIVLAKFADVQYQNVTKYISGEVFQSKIEFMKAAKKQVEDMRRSANQANQQTKQSLIIKQRQSNHDQEEIDYILKEQRNFIELALKYYLRGLKTSSDNDLLIFRAISLWLENEEDMDGLDLIGKTTKIFGEEKMPSYKYIVVLHQLSARLTKDNSARNNLLREILVKCAEDHPYHTLPVLLTQANLHQDEKVAARNTTSKVPLLADRVSAAAAIVTALKKSTKLDKLVPKMEVLWLALINLANIEDKASNAVGIDKNIPPAVMKYLKDLSSVAVPTCAVPVLQSGNYKDSVIYIQGFEGKYGLVGGINSPKKIKCRGSNGTVYNMLLKGQDDLRQDAVMQQVFGVMNKLLQVEQKTRTRRLHIRTYRVIPLSQRSGLIEWVENTQTFGEYLAGNNSTDLGAHGRYHPSNYKPMECRRMMLEAKQRDFEHKYTTYCNICENFKPVFRHFFFEKFKEPGVFFEKRLAYTRSVATTSIIGYILGLGDRHVLNILLDNSTAEFIHIDLGVAFEQGKILPTPETIPFRLTRDVVDGMGVSGVEGVFKRSCEMTMEVLRNNAEIIITVLQVLLYDPLYMWALTNDRVAKVQPSDTSKNGKKSSPDEKPGDAAIERNNSALRVLLRLRQKLMGIEEEGGATGAISCGSSLSIDGHVALLIQRAVDPKKLCRLFPGWQPYL